MSGVAKAVFGGSDSQARQVRQAQQEQAAQLERQNERLARAEAGQRAARSGGRGLLAFIEEQLARTLG